MTALRSAIDELSNPSLAKRQKALAKLADGGPTPAVEQPWVNMHMHSFFSFNGEGWSPTRLAWEAKRVGLWAAGIVDFDVLDGLEEFYAATDSIQLRATAGLETRTFFREYGEDEINSPGEPGVFYFMGVGFRSPPAADSAPAEVLASMLERAHARNRFLIKRINDRLEEITVDYVEDVLPLTPAGNATERHIVKAYLDKGMTLAGGDTDVAAGLWSRLLGLDVAETRSTAKDANAFADMLRSRLMKKGGIGYVQPDEKTFPLLDDVVDMILACEAVPTSTWLDGTRAGESNPEEQLECLLAKGVAATNIIPDRNWNVKDAGKAKRLITELHRYADVCRRMHIPVLIGTELNKPGQRFVDDFEAAAMKPLHDQFLFGASVMVGHTRFARYADFSYTGGDAANEYSNREKRNQAFAAVGALPPPPSDTRVKLDAMAAASAFSYLHDCARKDEWL